MRKRQADNFQPFASSTPTTMPMKTSILKLRDCWNALPTKLRGQVTGDSNCYPATACNCFVLNSLNHVWVRSVRHLACLLWCRRNFGVFSYVLTTKFHPSKPLRNAKIRTASVIHSCYTNSSMRQFLPQQTTLCFKWIGKNMGEEVTIPWTSEEIYRNTTGMLNNNNCNYTSE